MPRVRILQLIPSLAGGGAERMAAQLAAGLNPERFDALLVSLYPRQGGDLEALLAEARIPVLYLRKRRGLDARIFRALWTIVRRFRPHILHTHLHALRYAVPAIALRSVPYTVHTVHSIAEHERQDIGRFLPRLLFGHAVTPVSPAIEVRMSVERVFRAPSVVIPNGIPVAAFARTSKTRTEWRAEQGIEDEEVVLTCVGRLDRVKNHTLLIEAFARGPSSIPGTRLLLAGTGPLESALRSQVERRGIQAQVKFLGFRNDIAELLHASDVFVFASESEASPLSVMESLAAGLPVCGTSTGGVPELITSEVEGILVPPGNVDLLASALTRICTHSLERQSMGRAAASAAARLDISFMVNAYTRLYDDLIARSANSAHAN
jgi:glycosyltransferase involved in cell wall biosynthesis